MFVSILLYHATVFSGQLNMAQTVEWLNAGMTGRTVEASAVYGGAQRARSEGERRSNAYFFLDNCYLEYAFDKSEILPDARLPRYGPPIRTSYKYDITKITDILITEDRVSEGQSLMRDRSVDVRSLCFEGEGQPSECIWVDSIRLDSIPPTDYLPGRFRNALKHLAYLCGNPLR